MRREELAIEQHKSAHSQPRHQMRECDFGRITCPAEHGLAEKGPAKANSIKATNQLTIRPCFDTMGMSAGVEQIDRMLDLRVNPSIVPVRRGFSAEDRKSVV